MTAEQEKYIIEKYPIFWNGVFCPNSDNCSFAGGALFIGNFAKYTQFRKYMQMVFSMYRRTSEERKTIVKDIINKNYYNYLEYIKNTQLSNVTKNDRALLKIVYFLPYIKSYDDFVMSIAFAYGNVCLGNTHSKNTFLLNNEKDVRLVWELIRPDIIYNYYQNKDDSFSEYFLKLNHTLTKHNKYVYFGERFTSMIYLKYINIEKRRSYRFLLKLLQKNQYIISIIKGGDRTSFATNEQTIAPNTLYMFLYAFNKEMQFFNSEVFLDVFMKTLSFDKNTVTYRGLSQKAPYKLQQIFKVVRELQLSIDAEYKDDNEIINQQKTDK